MCSTTWCETSSGVVGASGLDVAVVAAAAADLVDEAHFSGWGWMGGRDVVDFWRDLRFWGGVFGGLECMIWVVD